jgi:predicted dehydrogenase
MYKVAVIGLGGISGTHLAQWEKLSEVKVVSGSDINHDAVARAVEAHGLQGYSDWRVMLDEQQPDLVSICTPPFLHREMAVECLQRGIHVLCEKPMAATVADARAIAEAAEQAASQFMVAYCHRFHGPAMKMQQLLAEGIIGRPIFFRGSFTGIVNFATNHRGSKQQAGGGALMDNGSHATDLYQFMLGPIRNVSCRAGTFMSDMETDDVGIILFEGEQGCFGEIIAGYALPGEFTQWIVTGEKGVLSLDDYFAGPVRFRPHDSQEWQEFPCDNSQTRFDRMFDHFVEAVKTNTCPLSNATTGLHVSQVLDAAYSEADQPGREVPG